MMPSILFSVIFPLAMGVLVVRTAWRPPATTASVLLQFIFASAFAIAISSCTFFLWISIPYARSVALPVAEPVLFMAAAIAFFLLKKPEVLLFSQDSRDSSLPTCRHAAGTDPAVRGLTICFFVVMGCAIACMILVLINRPLGLGDSYAIWNLRARFLFRDPEQWMKGFSDLVTWSHPDYPLLLPSSVARLWTYLEAETGKVPQAISLFFTLGTVALLAGALSFLRSAQQGLVAALFLMAVPFFTRLGSCQYADVPLGFFILATVVLLALKSTAGGNTHGLTFLAGVTAGFAAWTKNEGILFVVAVFVAQFSITSPRKNCRKWVGESLSLLGGCLPVIGLLVYFKVLCGTHNDILGSLDAGVLATNLADMGRSTLIGKAFGTKILHWGDGLMAIFLGYAIIAGGRPGKALSGSAHIGLMVILIMLAGYFAVYILTPHDLNWHLATSLERLLAQLWPVFLFSSFLIFSPVDNKRQTRQHKAIRPAAPFP